MQKVIVYSTTTCPWCVKVKNYFKEHHVEFDDVNVSEDEDAAKEMIEKSGQTGVPVIDIDGEMIIGFNKPEIDRALEKRKHK